MAGNTLGISIGPPVMMTIGVAFGWRAAFVVLGLIVVAIAVLVQFFLPSVDGERMSKSNSPLAIIRMPTILIVLLLTFLSVIAHYSIYTYITLLVERLDLPGGIGVALLTFGIGSVISVILSARYIDAYLRPLIVTALVAGGAAMALFLAFPASTAIAVAGFFLWGLAFGPLVTMYQTAVSRQIDDAKDVATSVVQRLQPLDHDRHLDRRAAARRRSRIVGRRGHRLAVARMLHPRHHRRLDVQTYFALR